MNGEKEKELNTFIAEWAETPEKNKKIFLDFKKHLTGQDGVTLDFIARPGVTYSLRAVQANQKDKELFVMVDVIEDTSRWLSVCFYGDMITDPDEKGDFVPGGLLGADAICFDLEEPDETMIAYVKARLDEAWQSAVNG